MVCALHVERGFSPLDEELELLPVNLTPRLGEWLVRLGTWMPFGRACQMLEGMSGARVSEATARRQVEGAGAAYVAVQEEQVEVIERQLPLPEPGAEKLLMSVDGAMVPLVRGEWAEVKTLVIGEVGEPVLAGGEKVVHTEKLSYFCRLADADSFSRLALVETQRRGVESAGRVWAVTDGAEWEQGFIDMHRSDAVRILDFAHAAERVSQVGQALLGEGSSEARQWLDERVHRLKAEGPGSLLAELRLLNEQQPQVAVLAENLAYLGKREGHMQYPLYVAQGFPLGSGAAESANKLVVEARLKGAGMHWGREHVNPMLGLRNIVCNDRWEEAWPKITAQLRQQARQGRQERRRQRLALGAIGQPSSPLTALPPAPQPVLTLAQEQPLSQAPPPVIKAKQPHRPGPDHPWRHSPIGKAKYLPYKRYPDAKL